MHLCGTIEEVISQLKEMGYKGKVAPLPDGAVDAYIKDMYLDPKLTLKGATFYEISIWLTT